MTQEKARPSLVCNSNDVLVLQGFHPLDSPLQTLQGRLTSGRIAFHRVFSKALEFAGKLQCDLLLAETFPDSVVYFRDQRFDNNGNRSIANDLIRSLYSPGQWT